MKILGLTGDIACGKSSVARLLCEWGAAHLDADQLVRELYSQREFAAHFKARLPANWGEFLDENGAVSREKLAPLVFGNPEKLRQLEAIVHPAVAELRAHKLEQLRENGARWVVLEAVKLLESGQGAICDQIWCVVASRETQKARLMQIRGYSASQAQERLQNQPPRERKLELAGQTPLRFIENDGTFDELKGQVRVLWTNFLAAN